MEKIATENLFLLEFLVDQCVILPCAISKEMAKMVGETCVCFKFLDNEPLDICEADFTPKRDYTEGESQMKNGKSCLFAMSPTQAEQAATQFDVDLCVFKKLANNTLPDKLQIGQATISVVHLYNDLIQLVQNKESSEPSGTVSRNLKDCFNILNAKGEVIGNISVFIRMSCFGKLIVTQFQMNLEDKSVFFKDQHGKSLYKYRKASKGERETKKDDGTYRCKPLRSVSYAPSQDGGAYSDDGRCADCSTGPVQAPGPVGNVSRLPDDKKGNYQEIGAEMNGNALKIRVHKDKGTIKRLDSGGEMDSYGPEVDSSPCACQSENVQRQQAHSSACCCLKDRPPCSDKQVLSLRPGDDPTNPFAFRVSGCPNAVNRNVTVVSPTSTRADGMQVTEISDPNRDVFVLRIGKKSEGVERKSNLELELVTPKGAEKKPIPKKETRETQYLASDAGPEGKKKKKKGGKKGKGKKGGKKGKKGKKK